MRDRKEEMAKDEKKIPRRSKDGRIRMDGTGRSHLFIHSYIKG